MLKLSSSSFLVIIILQATAPINGTACLTYFFLPSKLKFKRITNHAKGTPFVQRIDMGIRIYARTRILPFTTYLRVESFPDGPVECSHCGKTI
jgi:hypothetical protein